MTLPQKGLKARPYNIGMEKNGEERPQETYQGAVNQIAIKAKEIKEG